MKLNYSLTSGFASGDGAVPTTDNVDAWIAWTTDPTSTTLYLAPRAIPGLSENAALYGVLVGELGGVDKHALASGVNPQELAYHDGANATIELDAPLPAEAIRIVAAANRAGLRGAQAALADVPGERQFHVMSELYI
ncbi:hypothetical protein [Corynebacterium aquatimens]|uniref:Uncharacterized protein n=1 Tax=Corynebacterium aquatimens TaxID=1190508 RepID=A0A931E2H9_9CORY|nr:hypothetical protein [Corynebacterium aquatimens]MBG6122586.1 hypothetical protein [Corynebacterium aquatimens]WJY64874.1 hypothetical protein CAQUA_00635 [Corynebacterium aquatimens]